MSPIASRRFFIVVVLLVTAVAGALLRTFSSPQSTPYYLGTLLMVMWVPIVGNIISYLTKKLRPVAPAPLGLSMPFVAHVVVELSLLSEQGLDLPSKEQDGRIHCLLIVGTEGFSARVSVLESLSVGRAQGAEVQFLFPEAALPKLPVGSTFKLMQGRSGIGTGKVISLLPDA